MKVRVTETFIIDTDEDFTGIHYNRARQLLNEADGTKLTMTRSYPDGYSVKYEAVQEPLAGGMNPQLQTLLDEEEEIERSRNR